MFNCKRMDLPCLWLLILFISACSPIAVNTELEPSKPAAFHSDALTKTIDITALPKDNATKISTLSSLSTATSHPTEIPISTPVTPSSPPSIGNVTSFVYPQNTMLLETYVLTFLNAGGQWDELSSLLRELEINYDMIRVDMNGDGEMETAVYAKIIDNHSMSDHAWWVFQRNTASQYKIIYQTRGDWGFHDQFITDDVNGDHLTDIVIVGGFAGSACSLEPTILVWRTNRIINISPSYQELELGCSAQQRVLFQDVDDDGIQELVVIGETVGHMESAPPRGITQTFTLEDSGYKLVETTFAPADLLIHVIDDAQRALNRGDISSAIIYYEQAVYEDFNTVESYLFSQNLQITNHHPHAYQKAFALFRLFVIQSAIGNETEAEFNFMKLKEHYSKSQPGYEFTILSQVFFDAYKENKNLVEACQQVTIYTAEQLDGDGNEKPSLTHHFYWGGNIASYTSPDSFCPIFSVSQSDTAILNLETP